jgi:BirA family biotin operon repressor/biotin-[acetyl-CoA-carboxylase] ligase
LGWKIIKLNEVTSTQKIGRELAETTKGVNAVIVAKTQTEGRGSGKNEWYSPEGGLYFTVILNPIERVGLIPLLAGLSIFETIRIITGIRAELKWPNDVLIKGKKVSGVVTETLWSDGRVIFVLLGIGVNINSLIPKNLPYATSLVAEWGKEIELDFFLKHLLDRIEWNLSVSKKVPEKILREWEKNSNIFGKRVKINDFSGRKLEGIAIRLDPNGALILKNKDDEINVVSGRIE